MERRRGKKGGRRKGAAHAPLGVMRHDVLVSPASRTERQMSTLQDHEFMARAVRVDSAVQVGLKDVYLARGTVFRNHFGS